MTDKRNHQSDEANTPGLVPATQPGDPGAASSKLANTSPRAAPGTFHTVYAIPIACALPFYEDIKRYIYGAE